MPLPTILSGSRPTIWNPWIRELSSRKQWKDVLFHFLEMQKARTSQLTDHSLFPPILKACTNLGLLKQGKSVHACFVRHGFESVSSIGNSILDFYIKGGLLDTAMCFFDPMKKDSVSWNIVIHGFLDQGASEEGLKLFMQARMECFEPNISTLVLLLQVCRGLRTTHKGLDIHGYILRSGFLVSLSVQNSLLSLYADIDVQSARILFDEMVAKDVISWSAMIGGYVQSGEACDSLQLFREMSCEIHVKPDGLTVVSVLRACTAVADIYIGRMVHGCAICRGFSCDSFVGNSLIDMYSKCKDTESAVKAFNEMPWRNIVSWNSILSGFVHNKQYSEALLLFDLMLNAEVEADEVTIVNLLQTCKNLVDTIQCKSIHSFVMRRSFELNEWVMNSLVDAYAKCHLVELACRLFDHMKRRDVISWSTMIAGFTHCGKPDEAISLFQRMNWEQKPNAVTVLSLLEACSVSADLRRSKWGHGIAIRRGLAVELVIGTAILDMYSKCGAIDTARRVFDHMPEKNIVSWSAMIAAYGMNGFAREAIALVAKMEQHGMEPNGVTILSVLSACSHGGLVAEGVSYFERMVRDRGFKPELEHYSCIVDMLGRAGKLDTAMEVIKRMPQGGVKAGASAWGALLSACRSYGNSKLGGSVMSHVVELEPSNSAGYLLASSMYAAGGSWGDAASMRWLLKERKVRVVAGYSSVHVGSKSYRFVAGNRFHLQSSEIHAVIELLHNFMKMDGRIDVKII